jgi:hypothetical protein
MAELLCLLESHKCNCLTANGNMPTFFRGNGSAGRRQIFGEQSTPASPYINAAYLSMENSNLLNLIELTNLYVKVRWRYIREGVYISIWLEMPHLQSYHVV